ncbi:flavin reductase/cob(II)yrinic acid a,c-diamide reductase [Bradyrhizobium macuxiense]|uniref:Flavin reductase/cob(II)yrinic acid a,c-diamide reductase n=1 Tax=Bradyrhizobium macuxiense TaxID=1755647 RepID=A0A560KX83_9BRAD|nr:flavin reductase family protein [Bradyrhizobium macuxiense]TWB87802.1 flavin reductase/cob(II)yrinic acid a,c-diamide reductase [Bradyrhizobium macuxiense]
MDYQLITNQRAFWQAVGMRAIGTAVVTAQGPDGPAGFLALSTAHLSSEPPLMTVSIGRSTSALAAVLHSKHFAINFLAVGSEDLAAEFGGRGTRQGTDRFLLAEWTTMMSGAPTLEGAVGVIDCKLEDTIDRANTIIAVGRILCFASDSQRAPLVSFGGKFLGQ